MALDTPVVLIIYNRPQMTKKVLDAITDVQPRTLFVIGDGPRTPKEIPLCQAARSIVKEINWACDVQMNMADKNLGCRKRIVSGLNWVFSQVEEAIILEDDCLPHPSFFQYCQNLLMHYCHNEHVMEIGGGNYQAGQTRSEYSYYFSKYSHTHGWATWRRAWRYFDESIAAWPYLKQTAAWNLICGGEQERQYWNSIYNMIFEGKLTTSWDYQWQFARWCRGGVAAVPNVNLVSNIGFGRQATHTRWKCKALAHLPTHDIGTIRHPPAVVGNLEADRYMFRKIFQGNMFCRALRHAGRLWDFSTVAQ